MRHHVLTIVCCLALFACGDSGPDTGASDETTDDAQAMDASAPDATGDAGPPDSEGDTSTVDVSAATDVAEADSGPDGTSADVAQGEGTPRLRAYADAPTGSTLPDAIESCPVIAEERCEGDTVMRCSLYDADAGGWATDVPPMTEQAFWFDRYFDLYHTPNGLSMDVDFTDHMLAGTPESEWSKPESFRKYSGRGDSSGWTATALWGAAARYAVTGTEADYERMLARTEVVTFLYEVTNIPGMLA
ncbi:MAG: hypothetical protein QF464_07900, partial [Myxococcota bacterium]|nr:hypothetical protein [Myxococcota bacterium]